MAKNMTLCGGGASCRTRPASNRVGGAGLDVPFAVSHRV